MKHRLAALVALGTVGACALGLVGCHEPGPAPAASTEDASVTGATGTGSSATHEPVRPPSAPSDGGATQAVGPLPKPMELYRAADSAFQAGDYPGALKKAEDAASADPSLTVAWNLVGRAAEKQFEKTRDGKYATKAQEAYGRAVKLDPNFLPAWQNLGELDEKLGRTKDAADAYAKVLALAPDHPDKQRLTAFIQQAGAGGAKPGPGPGPKPKK